MASRTQLTKKKGKQPASGSSKGKTSKTEVADSACVQDGEHDNTSLLDDNQILSDLTVIAKPLSHHGNSKAVCWKYVGHLCRSGTGEVVDAGRYYCSLCLEEKKLDGADSRLAHVVSFAMTTSTGNMNIHLSSKHNILSFAATRKAKRQRSIKECKQEPMDSQESMISQESMLSISSITNDDEFNRDLVIWLCRDLLPLEILSNQGTIAFLQKNVTQFDLPTPQGLSSTTLDDVYVTVFNKVKEMMSDVKSVCLMFDEWTDRYRRLPYLAVRAAFIKDWKFHVVTLGCHILPSFNSHDIAAHVTKLVGKFIPDTKKIMISYCHNSTGNLCKAFQLMNAENCVHCAARALNLVLTVDSLNEDETLVNIMQRCKTIIHALHYKCALIEEELFVAEERELVEQMKDIIGRVNNIIELEEQFTDEGEYNGDDGSAHTQNKILKLSWRPTRWNSILLMIEFVLDLRAEIQNMLKRINRLDLCLNEREFDVLAELRLFLSSFKDFGDLVSNEMPTLSLVQLMKAKITKLCTSNVTDDDSIASMKARVLQNLDRRFPITTAMQISQLLDPETKDIIPHEDGIIILERAIQSACAKNLIQVEGQVVKSNAEDGPECKRRRIRQELIDEMKSVAAESSHSSTVTLEVTNYLTMRSNESNGVLSFWSEHERTFPVLSQLAVLYLTMSASSVPIDWMFSTAGIVSNGKRCMIGPDRMNKMSFVHDNMKLF